MKFGVVAMVAPLLVLGAGVAHGQESGSPSTVQSWFSGNVSVTSDYSFRGISQTLEEPAIQGGLDLRHPWGLYLGTWGSSVNFGEDLSLGDRAQMELDLYGGIGRSLFGLATVDLGFIYYAYPGAENNRNYDFLEFGLGASRSVGPLSPAVSLKYSPDFFAESGEALYYGASLGVPVSFVTLNGSVGRQQIERNDVFGTPDYTDWGLGASVGFVGLSFTGKYIDTSLDDDECFGGSDLCGSRVVFSISRAF